MEEKVENNIIDVIENYRHEKREPGKRIMPIRELVKIFNSNMEEYEAIGPQNIVHWMNKNRASMTYLSLVCERGGEAKELASRIIRVIQ